MEKVGILVVSYGSRGAALADKLKRSEEYNIELYIVDRQRNPFNVKIAEEHAVIPDLNINKIHNFVKHRKSKIDFGIVGPEKPIIEGVRDLIEKESGIPLICPIKKYAIEASKVRQRKLFEKVVPKANPRFKVFSPKDYSSLNKVRLDLRKWLDELNNEVVVKPDKPAAGKGVGVWGDHFKTREELFEHFKANFQYGPVIVEEKLVGEESSFQCFCDGRRIVPLPETRDYKRAFEGDHGPNTGGMGSYKDSGNFLPFMRASDWEVEVNIAKKLFRYLSGEERNPGLIGVPFYLAFIHTAEGVKILENNSRPGDPEIINVLPILKDDFVEVCMSMIDGDLGRVNFERHATVVVYKVPPNYGGFIDAFPEKVDETEVGSPIDLSGTEDLKKRYGDKILFYPGSLELRDGAMYALRSRTICSVGVDRNIEGARRIAFEGIRAIKGGALWYRNDIASPEHISRSIERMRKIRVGIIHKEE